MRQRACSLHHQMHDAPSGILHSGLLPGKRQRVEDGIADFFYFPPYESTVLAIQFWVQVPVHHDQRLPATRAFFQYLTEASAHEVWMSQSQFLTAHKGADLSAYSSPR